MYIDLMKDNATFIPLVSDLVWISFVSDRASCQDHTASGVVLGIRLNLDAKLELLGQG